MTASSVVRVEFATAVHEGEIVLSFLIGGKFQTTVTITADAAHQIADALLSAATEASSPIHTTTTMKGQPHVD